MQPTLPPSVVCSLIAHGTCRNLLALGRRVREGFYFFSSWIGRVEGSEDIQLIFFFFSKGRAIWINKRVKPPWLVKKWGANPEHTLKPGGVSSECNDQDFILKWNIAASSVRSGEGFMCLLSLPLQPNLGGVITPQTWPSELFFCQSSCDGLGTQEAQLVRRDNNF